MTRKAAFQFWLATTLAVLAAVPMAVPSSAQQPKTLRVAMHADVRTLDPFWTTQTIAGIHGLMVYDTLFSSDAELNPQPQMVDKWTVSEDRKIYDFTLRDGLKFHDGSPVTSKDVVASMHRWGKRDGAGKQLFEYTDIAGRQGRQDLRLDAEGALRPADRHPGQDRHQHPVRDAREGGDGRPLPADHRRWSAPARSSSSATSGCRAARPSTRSSQAYVPRKEPASGHAGGKVVKVDRVEFVWLSDPQTAQSALVAGEIDYLENPAARLPADPCE